VEGGEGLDGAVDGHGVEAEGAARRHQHPVRGRPADEHLEPRGGESRSPCHASERDLVV
jgi:hypothetical protein